MTSNQNKLLRVACQMITCQMRNEIIKDDALKRVWEESSKHHCQSTRHHLSHDAWLILSLHCSMFRDNFLSEDGGNNHFYVLFYILYYFQFPCSYSDNKNCCLYTYTQSRCIRGFRKENAYPSLERKISSGFDCLCNVDMSE